MRPQDVHSRRRSEGGSVTSCRRSALGADQRPFNLRVEEFQPASVGDFEVAAGASAVIRTSNSGATADVLEVLDERVNGSARIPVLNPRAISQPTSIGKRRLDTR
jgi:hypothetical protein